MTTKTRLSGVYFDLAGQRLWSLYGNEWREVVGNPGEGIRVTLPITFHYDTGGPGLNSLPIPRGEFRVAP